MALYTLLIDAADVLFIQSHRNDHLLRFLESYGVEPRHPVVVERALRAAYFDVLHGRITRDEYYDAKLRFYTVPDEGLAEGRAALFKDAMVLEMVPNAVATFSSLKEQGLELVVVANSEHPAAELTAWLQRAGLPAELWTGLFTSCEIRLSLPDPAFFKHVLETVKSEWHGAAYLSKHHVGDAVLVEYGLRVITFQPEVTVLPFQYTIQALEDLPSLLVRLAQEETI